MKEFTDISLSQLFDILVINDIDIIHRIIVEIGKRHKHIITKTQLEILIKLLERDYDVGIICDIFITLGNLCTKVNYDTFMETNILDVISNYIIYSNSEIRDTIYHLLTYLMNSNHEKITIEYRQMVCKSISKYYNSSTVSEKSQMCELLHALFKPLFNKKSYQFKDERYNEAINLFDSLF